MTRNIWVVSDTHFNQTSILKFTDKDGAYFRGDLFKSAEEMDETMVDNWNKVVKPGDKVYHLGDVFFGDKEYFKTLWGRLNGSKRLVVGNHDDIKFLSQGAFFKKVCMWRILSDFGVTLTHVPFREEYLRTPLNVHGHIHQNPAPSKRHICVCVEQTGYTPINLEDLRDYDK